ncbi:MAG: amino acid ABC transporter substrate-binding protein [Chloroflexi bacterium]|nr:amino acid ABC transporter substrate-binding protein [Chloroflexota bacterium]
MSRKLIVLFAVFIVSVLVIGACAAPAPAAEPAPAEQQPAPAEQPATTSTLAVVQERGKLICGANQAVPGFGFLQSDGTFAGFDIDFCKALAAAVFGDAGKVEYRPLNAKQRFTALQAGEIDVLIRNTTWTLTRDTELGANFAPTTFYDGQGITVRKDSGINSLEDLEGASICVSAGTTTELNLADQMAARGINYTPVVFETADETTGAYLDGRCDAYTTDKSGLVARMSLFPNPEEHKILDETLSKEPLGPVVRQGDDQWFDIVKWVVFATFTGEEMGINSQNVDEYKANATDPNVRKLLGLEGDMGVKLGLSNDWAYNIIKLVGNYAEIYDRNLGPDTVFNLPRGLNASWVDGGLLYAPPIR